MRSRKTHFHGGWTLKYSRVSVIRLSVVSRTRLYIQLDSLIQNTIHLALYGILFSLVRPSQFCVQIFESRLGRITEIPLYILNELHKE